MLERVFLIVPKIDWTGYPETVCKKSKDDEPKTFYHLTVHFKSKDCVTETLTNAKVLLFFPCGLCAVLSEVHGACYALVEECVE